jgi:predicted phosphohydrolase
MSLFAIGDLHLSLSSDKPMDVFGDHWKDHHLALERNWREAVGETDTVLIPGDLSWAMDMDGAMADLMWLDGLPGRKLMIKGNHDYWWTSLSRMRELLPKSILPLQNGAVDLGAAVVTGTRGWLTPFSEGYSEEKDGKVYRRELLRMGMALDAASRLMIDDRALIVMMHYPPVIAGEGSEFSRIMSERGVDLCVYGHMHMTPGFWPDYVDMELDGVRYRLVSADRLDFHPLELEVG